MPKIATEPHPSLLQILQNNQSLGENTKNQIRLKACSLFFAVRAQFPLF